MNKDAIDRKLVCAFIDGLISDDGERKKGLEYIRNMPPVETHDKRTETHACDYIRRQDVLNLAKKGVLISNGNYESVCKAINGLPPVNPQEPKTDSWSIKDVADTFKKHGLIRKQEPCKDAIDRAEAVRVASGYCHPANVAKELAKLPPVNPHLCEDAISRQAVIDMLNNAQILSVESGDYCGYCTEDIDIESIPPVTPQPKTGHWIWEVSSHKCSACNEYTCFEDSKPPKYCPNCGCRMVEPQERSDKA